MLDKQAQCQSFKSSEIATSHSLAFRLNPKSFMKLRFFLVFSLILHATLFVGMSGALWQFLFPMVVHDLTVVELIETLPREQNSAKKTAVAKRVEAPKVIPTRKQIENESQSVVPPHETPSESASGEKNLEAVSVGAVTVAPKVLKEKRIAYPERARRAGVEGIVELKLVIDPQGRVREAEVQKGLGFGLDEAALSAIKEFEFSPAKIKLDPVAVRIIYKYRFQLNR